MVALTLILGVILVAILGRGVIESGEDETNQPVFQVAQGRLVISVTESGTIQPREQIIIKSEVEGNNTILYLIPEGTLVKEGDLLVELDASRHEDSKVDQEIAVQNAEAAFVRSDENLAVVRSDNCPDYCKCYRLHQPQITHLLSRKTDRQ